jgi:nickel-dependent lactate racemase
VTTIRLDYGQTGLDFDTVGLNTRVLRPTYPDPLPDPAAAFTQAVRQPTNALPLRDFIAADHNVAIAIPDITRALPNQQLLGYLFEELAHVPSENFIIVAGTGTHRGHTEAEWRQIVGPDIFEKYTCIDHDGQDDATMVDVGQSRFGYPVKMNRQFAQADRRILMGFIEPHFMAGFSGGYKACFPGVTAVSTILHYHNAANIGHPQSTWGLIENNPTQHHVRAGGSLLDHQFLINVTLDEDRAITGYFCGDPIAAHERGCDFCKQTAMHGCDQPFKIVITTNSGYPLDQNLYQTVKGLCAAAEIVEQDGLILAAARCNDGFPEHGLFKQLLAEHDSPDELLRTIESPGFHKVDQWQAQKLAVVLQKARVGLFSELPDADARLAHLEPVKNIRLRIDEELQARDLPPDTPIAILPEGPLTIPYLK